MACRQGDESAWEALVHRYQNLLFSIPRRAGLNRDLAADVLQNVFTTLFIKIGSLEKPEFVRAWLITTARHKTIHLISKETRGRPVSIDDDENEVPVLIADGSPSAVENLIRVERDLQIGEAFEQLDPRCRQLLTMLYLDDDKTPYGGIADILDIPLGSIGPTRARCLKKLLKFMPG